MVRLIIYGGKRYLSTLNSTGRFSSGQPLDFIESGQIKSPGMLCFKQEAATAKSITSAGLCPASEVFAIIEIAANCYSGFSCFITGF